MTKEYIVLSQFKCVRALDDKQREAEHKLNTREMRCNLSLTEHVSNTAKQNYLPPRN
jgi:hypothetical protein